MKVRRFATAELPAGLPGAIRRLLDDAFAGDFSDADWEHALGGRHVVVGDGDDVLAHAAVVARVLDVAGRPLRAGYLEAVGTAPGRHGEGLGSLAVADVTTLVRDEFELGALSTGRHAFYARHGWERWQGPTFARHGARTVRTEEDDDGVMVLRFGPSAAIDLAAPITCEGRRGDDW